MVVIFINERCFKTYNTGQYSNENDVLIRLIVPAILDESKSFVRKTYF